MSEYAIPAQPPGSPPDGTGWDWDGWDWDPAASLTAHEIAALAALDRAGDLVDDWEDDSSDAGDWEDDSSDAGPVDDGLCSAPGVGAAEALPGLLPRRLGTGGGFDAGGVADRLPPGPVLAGLTADKWAAGPGQVSDDELAGLMMAWRRLASWAAAGELAVVAELCRRREAQAVAGAGPGLAEHVGDEVAMVLTLTSWAAGTLVDRAVGLARLPKTMAALAAGEIDMPKALVILSELAGLSRVHAARVEAAVIGQAAGWTTGELGRAVRRLVIAADPAAARTRKQKAEKRARVERWAEDAGTAALAGRDLPPAGVLAADAYLTAWAQRLKAAGVTGTLDQLRAQVYLALLNGKLPGTLLPTAGHGHPEPANAAAQPEPADAAAQPEPADAAAQPEPADAAADREPASAGADGEPASAGADGEPASAGADREPASAGADREPASAGADREPASAGADREPASAGADGEPAAAGTCAAGPPAPGRPAAKPGAVAGPAGLSVRGSVNLVLPLSAWLGWSAAPGEVAGFGPLDAADSRALAAALARDPATTWCVTVTGAGGRAAAHGCAKGGPGPPPAEYISPGGSPGPPAGGFLTDQGPGPPPEGRFGAGQSPRLPPVGRTAPGGSSGPPPLAGAAPGGSSGPPPLAGAAPGGSSGPLPLGSVGSGGSPGPLPVGRFSPGGSPGFPLPPRMRAWLASVPLAWLEAGECGHRRESPGYRPSRLLTHLIQVRQGTCTAPGCRRPATSCDFEHTIPYHQGGRSCECNGGPCCRRHHRAKQTTSWQLSQPRPGTFIWTTPHGRSYQTEPITYPT